MIMVLINLMRLVEVKYKRIQKTGKKLPVKLEDGLILKMIIKQWMLDLWRVFGGFSKNYLIKI